VGAPAIAQEVETEGLTGVGGTVVMIVVLVLVIPVGIIMSGAIVSAVLGMLLKRDNDLTHAGTELHELSQRS
jgi:hypothetical protein